MIRRTLAVAALTASFLILQTPAAGADDTPAARRHAAFEQLGAAFKTVNETLKADNPASAELVASTGRLKTLAVQLPAWFPKGSGPESGAKTGAKAEIWSDPPGFATASNALVAETAKLEQFGRAGDVVAMRAQVKAVGGACRSCHEKYRTSSFGLFAR